MRVARCFETRREELRRIDNAAAAAAAAWECMKAATGGVGGTRRRKGACVGPEATALQYYFEGLPSRFASFQVSTKGLVLFFILFVITRKQFENESM